MLRRWPWTPWTRKTPSIRRKRGRTHLSARPLEERAVPAVFASADTNVIINDNGPASPYPTTVVVSGLTGQVITDLNVTIKNLSHTQVQDVDILLVAPDGTNIVLMSDNGGTSAATNVTLTFDDAALGTIGSGPIAGGTYKPENIGAGDVFPGGPASPPVTTLGAFNGLDPNGTWELRVVDDTFLDSGSFGDPLGAWLLDISSKANQAPVALDDAYSTPEDTTLSVGAKGVLANDTDGDNDPLTAVLVSGTSNGKLTLNADGSFDYVPVSNYNGPDSFTYKAYDGLNFSGVAKVSITVNPVADPALAFNDRYVTLQNAKLTRDADSGVLANDQNPDAAPRVRIYFEDFEGLPLVPFSPGVMKGDGTDFAKNLPAGWERVVGPTTPLTGPEEFTGWHVFDIDSWIAEQDDQSRSNFTRGGVGKNGQVLVADGDALDDYVSINPNKYSTLATTRPVSLAGVLPNSLRLEFDSSFRPEDPGTQFAKVEVTYDAGATWSQILFYDTDNTPGGVGSTVRTNEHLVFDLDNPPTATSVQVRFSYLEAGNDWWWALDNIEMSANRTDRKSMTATKVAGPSNGALTLNADGSFNYTPNAGFVGTDSFTYNAINALGFSNLATVQISVVAANPSAPVGNPDRYTLPQGGVLAAVSNFGVLADDTDPDGDPLTAALVFGPANGKLTLNSAGAFTYTPNASFSGIDSFTYTASDGTNTSAATTVTLVVEANNFSAPIAKNDAYSLSENGSLSVSAATGVLANDSDPDGNPLTVSLVAGANRGTLTLNANGSLTYVPFPGFSGTDSFTYVARDGLFDSNVATVTLTVNPDATPFALPDAYSTKQGQALNVGPRGVLANDLQAGTEVVLYTEDFESFVLGPYSLGVGGGNGTDWTSFLPAGWTRDTPPLPTPLYAASIPPDFAGWNIMDIDSWIGNQGGQNRQRFTRGGAGLNGQIIVADGDALDDFYTTPTGVTPSDPGIDPNLYSTFFTTQPVPLAGLLPGSLRLEFDSSFRPESPGTQFALVDVSFDGGTSWTNLLKYQTENSGGTGSLLRVNERVGLNVPNPTSGDALFRFGYTEAGNDWWWAIDNLRVTGETGTPNLTAEKVTNPANGALTLNPDGSFTYTPNAGFFGTDSFTYSAKSGSLVSPPTTVTINVAATQPVRVASVQVNDGSDQRSRVTSLRIAFDQQVSFTGAAADAFQLKRQGDNALVTLAAAVNNTGPGTVVTLTFTGGAVNGASLADGRYTLNIDAAQVSNANGALDGNGDGTGGDSFELVGDPATNKLFRLFGDIDGDGDVDAQDFGAFRAAFGGTSNLAFDFDGDGDVDAQDFGQFRSRFGASI
jgi:hypothetical protein